MLIESRRNFSNNGSRVQTASLMSGMLGCPWPMDPACLKRMSRAGNARLQSPILFSPVGLRWELVMNTAAT